MLDCDKDSSMLGVKSATLTKMISVFRNTQNLTNARHQMGFTLLEKVKLEALPQKDHNTEKKMRLLCGLLGRIKSCVVMIEDVIKKKLVKILGILELSSHFVDLETVASGILEEESHLLSHQ